MAMMIIKNKHNIGDTVYLSTDKEQNPRIVIAIIVYMSGELLYKLICGTIESNHYDIEISIEKNILIDA